MLRRSRRNREAVNMKVALSGRAPGEGSRRGRQASRQGRGRRSTGVYPHARLVSSSSESAAGAIPLLSGDHRHGTNFQRMRWTTSATGGARSPESHVLVRVGAVLAMVRVKLREVSLVQPHVERVSTGTGVKEDLVSGSGGITSEFKGTHHISLLASGQGEDWHTPGDRVVQARDRTGEFHHQRYRCAARGTRLCAPGAKTAAQERLPIQSR
jgi:hypothetical protein